MSIDTTANTTGDSSGNYVFGLPRLWAAVLNVGAVLLICAMFYQDRRESLALAKEDRTIFRTALERLSESSNRQGQAISTLSQQIEKLADRIDQFDRRKAKTP